MKKSLYLSASALVLRRCASMMALPRCAYMALPLCLAVYDNAMAFGAGSYGTAPVEYAQPGAISDAATNYVSMNSVLDRALEQDGTWGFWPSFRLSTTQHDGFQVDHPPSSRMGNIFGPDPSQLTQGPRFRQDEQSLLLGVQYNLTGAEKAYSLKIGAFGALGRPRRISIHHRSLPRSSVLTPPAKQALITLPAWVGCTPSELLRIFICLVWRAAMTGPLISIKSEILFKLTPGQGVS